MSALSILPPSGSERPDPTPSTEPAKSAELAEVIQQERTRHRRRRIVWAALALLAAATATITYLQLRPQPLTAGELYRTEPLVGGVLIREVTATGRIEARSTVEVGAELSGRVDEVLVDYNSRVEAGQVLARFDTANVSAQQRQARAAVRAARASVKRTDLELAEAQRHLKRSEALHAKAIESQVALETARSRVALAEASLDNARAQVELQRANLSVADTTLERAEIRAPIDGQVLAVNIEAGQTVAASFQTPVLFLIAADLRQMRVLAQIDEADIGEVTPEQAASFTVDAYPGETFKAHVTEVRSAASIVQNVVTYEAVLDVDNRGLRLKPGMTASVRVETNRAESALQVPNAALRFTPPGESRAGRPEVWVLDGGSVRRVPVDAGISDGARTIVSGSGLATDSRVIVDLTPEGRESTQEDA